MYLNIGAEKDLPTTESYDIKRDEWFTEHIELDTQSEYFKKNKIETMQNTILIGIYAKENSIIFIDAEESKSRMKTLSHGKGVLIDQPANDQRFFQYIHKGDTGIKFELTGLHGEVDMRINCYNPHQLDGPLSSYIPQDERTSKWDSNSKESTSIIIENEDEEYCKNGVYLIAITSREEGAKYTIEAQRGESFTSKQIKIGVPIKDTIADTHEKQYMFILDKKKPFKVHASIYSGMISFSIGDKKDFTKPIHESEDDHIEVSKSDVKKFKTGENIYIRVRGEFDQSEFILVVTHDDSYSIIPDSFTQTFSMDPRDEEGLRLMYYPPNIDHEMKIQVNGYSDAVYFHVERKIEYLYQINKDKLAFPKFDEKNFPGWFTNHWDTQARHYIETVQMKSKRTDEYVVLFTIFPRVIDPNLLDKDKDKVKVSVNINSHQMNILTPNVAQEISLSTEVGDYSYFKFFTNGHKDINVNLIPCMCMTEMFIYKTYNNAVQHSSSIERSHTMVNGMKSVLLKNASGPYYIKVQIDSSPEWEDAKNATEYCAFQIVFYDKNHPNFKYSIESYYPENQGIIEYDWPKHGNLHLSWGRIMKEGLIETQAFPTIGTMFAFKERSVFANSICGLMHHEVRNNLLYHEVGLLNQEKTLKIHEMSQFKNQKSATFYFYASVNRDGAAVMFQPTTVSLDIGWGIPWMFILAAIVIISVLAYAVYYFKTKADTTKEKLDYEMNDIRNVAGVGVPYPEEASEDQEIA